MAEALEVSRRTIYRDIDVLCEAGYPIITTTGQKGGITFVDGYKLNLDQTNVTLKTLITHLYAMPEQERFINALESGMNLKYMSAIRLRPDDFMLKSYWSFSIKTFKESKKDSEYYPVEIKVHESFGSIFEKYDLIGIKKVGDSVIGMIDLHRKDVAEEEIRAILCYGQILYPEEMKLKARDILESSIQMYNN